MLHRADQPSLGSVLGSVLGPVTQLNESRGRVTMRTRPGSVVNQGRRRLRTTIAMAIAAAVVAGPVLATSVLARNATSADQIEHHIAKIDGTRFHYATAGTGDPVLLIPG